MTDDLDVYLKDLEEGLASPFLATLARGAIGLLPFTSPLLELHSGNAQRVLGERIRIVLSEMRSNLRDLSSAKIDRDFFRTEEFHTIAILLLEWIRTTHREEKLKMFGSALANAANADFIDDDKELFVRILGDLSPGDLQMLASDGLSHRMQYHSGVDIARLSRLLGMGLVLDTLRPPDALRAFGPHPVSLREAPNREFLRSDFGKRFLQFISASNGDTSE